jgi:hypothetical protein
MDLGPHSAVMLIVAIMATIVISLVIFCKYETGQTNKTVLYTMFLEMCSQIPFEYISKMEITRFGNVHRFLVESAYVNVEFWFDVFTDVFFQLPLKELKKIKISQLDEDKYNMWQDVDDILRHARETKEKNT